MRFLKWLFAAKTNPRGWHVKRKDCFTELWRDDMRVEEFDADILPRHVQEYADAMNKEENHNG